jgi:formiminotetrahydrofolate cyclodeaminase
MNSPVSDHTVGQFIDEIGSQNFAMAGAVIAASAAQAAALGLACLQISVKNQPEAPHLREMRASIEQVLALKNSLVEWCNRDAAAIAEFVALREAGDMLGGQQLLCDAPVAVGRLAGQAATILQNFRPLVSERVQDDLEISITLLAGTTQAAMLLLDSNLRIWPEIALLDKYEPIRAELERQIGQLTPVARIRK